MGSRYIYIYSKGVCLHAQELIGPCPCLANGINMQKTIQDSNNSIYCSSCCIVPSYII